MCKLSVVKRAGKLISNIVVSRKISRKIQILVTDNKMANT